MHIDILALEVFPRLERAMLRFRDQPGGEQCVHHRIFNVGERKEGAKTKHRDGRLFLSLSRDGLRHQQRAYQDQQYSEHVPFSNLFFILLYLTCTVKRTMFKNLFLLPPIPRDQHLPSYANQRALRFIGDQRLYPLKISTPASHCDANRTP